MTKKKEMTAKEQGFPPVEQMDATKFVKNRKKENKPNFTNIEVKEFYKPAEVKMIDILEIHPSPINPRKTFDDDSLNELAKNISEQGILQPITVRQMDNKRYEIVCGERRYRAANIAGLPFIPCIVRNLTDDEAFDVMITENLQRKDVEPMDEARAFIELSKRGAKVEELAARFGKSQAFILGRIKLNDLIDEFSSMIEKKELQVSHAMELCKFNADEQFEFYKDRYKEDVNNWNSWRNKTVKELKQLLSSKFRDLDKAEFDKTECENCQHNCSVNLLFHEFNKNNCTNRACFIGKEINHDVEVAIEKVESGYILVRKKDRENEVTKRLEELGYEFTLFDNNFEWPAEPEELDKDDFDTEEEFEKAYNDANQEYLSELEEETKKVESKEYQKAWCVAYWNDPCFIYLTKSKETEADNSNPSTNDVKKLQEKDERNKEIQQEKTIEDTKKLIEESNYLKMTDDLSDLEELVFLVCIINESGWKKKKELELDSYGLSPDKILKAAKGITKEQRNSLIRSFIMKDVISDLHSSFGKLYQQFLIQISGEKFTRETEEIKLKHEGVYLKRQENINKRIAELKNK